MHRNKTHTNQYLQFSSHHPLHQKLEVIRTVLDRNESIGTEEEDRQFEEEHSRKHLSVCVCVVIESGQLTRSKKTDPDSNLIPLRQKLQIKQHL